MTFQHQPGCGSLFQNDKEGNEKRPDWRGDINIEGKNYRIAGWFKPGKNGEFISLKVDDKPAPDISSKVNGKPRTKGDDYRAKQSGDYRVAREKEPPQDIYNDDIPW